MAYRELIQTVDEQSAAMPPGGPSIRRAHLEGTRSEAPIVIQGVGGDLVIDPRIYKGERRLWEMMIEAQRQGATFEYRAPKSARVLVIKLGDGREQRLESQISDDRPPLPSMSLDDHIKRKLKAYLHDTFPVSFSLSNVTPDELKRYGLEITGNHVVVKGGKGFTISTYYHHAVVQPTRDGDGKVIEVKITARGDPQEDGTISTSTWTIKPDGTVPPKERKDIKPTRPQLVPFDYPLEYMGGLTRKELRDFGITSIAGDSIENSAGQRAHVRSDYMGEYVGVRVKGIKGAGGGLEKVVFEALGTPVDGKVLVTPVIFNRDGTTANGTAYYETRNYSAPQR